MKRITQNYVSNFDMARLDAAPTTLNVEATNVCNLRCVMCPQRTMRRARGFMDVELFRAILDEAADMGVTQVGLHTVGESILHPQLDRFVAASKARGLYTYLDVNGNAIAPGMHERLLDAGLDSLKFSMDAADPETYAKIRRGGDFHKVMENLKTFDRLRKERGHPMRLYAFYIICALNEQGVAAFKDVVGPYVDEVEYFTVLNQGEQYDGFEELSSPILREMMAKHRKPTVCPNPFRRINITWDGWLTACCVDFENALAYAKYEPGRLAELWQCAAARDIRAKMAALDLDDLPLCRNCTMAQYDIPALCVDINERF